MVCYRIRPITAIIILLSTTQQKFGGWQYTARIVTNFIIVPKNEDNFTYFFI